MYFFSISGCYGSPSSRSRPGKSQRLAPVPRGPSRITWAQKRNPDGVAVCVSVAVWSNAEVWKNRSNTYFRSNETWRCFFFENCLKITDWYKMKVSRNDFVNTNSVRIRFLCATGRPLAWKVQRTPWTWEVHFIRSQAWRLRFSAAQPRDSSPASPA